MMKIITRIHVRFFVPCVLDEICITHLRCVFCWHSLGLLMKVEAIPVILVASHCCNSVGARTASSRPPVPPHHVENSSRCPQAATNRGMIYQITQAADADTRSHSHFPKTCGVSVIDKYIARIPHQVGANMQHEADGWKVLRSVGVDTQSPSLSKGQTAD